MRGATHGKKWLTIALLVLGASFPEVASADAIGGVLWFNQAVAEATVLWQLLPSGHAYMRVDLFRPDGPVRVSSTTDYAFSFSASTYDQVRSAMVRAGLRDGAHVKCARRALAGITPQLELNLVSEDCEQVGRLLESIDRIVGPIAQTAIKGAQRWAGELQQRTGHCPISEMREVTVTRKRDGTVSSLSGVSPCFFPAARLEQEWSALGESLEVMEYRAQLHANGALPITLFLPSHSPAPLVHGFDVADALGTHERRPRGPGTLAYRSQSPLPLTFQQSADFGAKQATLAWPPGYPVRPGESFDPELSIWLLPALWHEPLSIKLDDGRQPQGRLGLAKGQLSCEGFGFCTQVTESQLRGLVAAAMGACLSSARERSRRPNQDRLRVAVAAGTSRCEITFKDICLEHADAGLDMLFENREPRRLLPPPQKAYPVCGYEN